MRLLFLLLTLTLLSCASDMNVKNFENEICNVKLIKPINASMEDIKKNVINKVA